MQPIWEDFRLFCSLELVISIRRCFLIYDQLCPTLLRFHLNGASCWTSVDISKSYKIFIPPCVLKFNSSRACSTASTRPAAGPNQCVVVPTTKQVNDISITTSDAHKKLDTPTTQCVLLWWEFFGHNLLR